MRTVYKAVALTLLTALGDGHSVCLADEPGDVRAANAVTL